MEYSINQSFSEVYDIINHFDKNMYEKIPSSFIEMIKQNRDQKYNVSLDYSKKITEQKLLYETRVILSIIYRDYICTKEKRQELLEKEKLELMEKQSEMNQKFNVDEIFNKKQNNHIHNEENVQLVEYKESVFKRLINKILEFFKIKS